MKRKLPIKKLEIKTEKLSNKNEFMIISFKIVYLFIRDGDPTGL